MGRIVVRVRVENAEDRERAERGEIDAAGVRSTQVEALVDTGATFFCLPETIVKSLGLKFHRTRPTKTVTGEIALAIHGTAIIEVEGRNCHDEVMVLPDGRQPLLGQIPLEKMDWWVDLTNRKLVGNPEHGGQWMAEAY